MKGKRKKEEEKKDSCLLSLVLHILMEEEGFLAWMEERGEMDLYYYKKKEKRKYDIVQIKRKSFLGLEECFF